MVVVPVWVGFKVAGDKLARARARRRRPGLDAETIDAVADRVLVPIPVAHQSRQSGRHRLQWGEAEGLLDGVRQGDEDVRRRPGSAVGGEVLSVDEDRPDVRAKAGEGGFEDTPYRGV